MKTIWFVGQVLMVFVGATVAFGDDGSARRYCDWTHEDDTSRAFSLVGRKEVQKDLALTMEQVGRLKRTWRIAKQDVPGLESLSTSFKKLIADPMLSDHDRGKLGQSYTSGTLIFYRTYERQELSQTLTTRQMQRLRELLIQMRGPMILTEDASLARAVHLSDERINDMKEAIQLDVTTLDGFRKRLRRAMIAGVSANETIQDRDRRVRLLYGVILAVEKSQDEQLLSSLTPEQRGLWTASGGMPLSIDWPLENLLQDPFDGKEGGSGN